ncbi:MAG: Lrp/AsnC ligand binding domain-containing protein [Nitrososphaerales archaeon]
MRAYIFITAKPGTSEDIVKAVESIKTVKGVTQADSIYGRFDVIVTLEADTLEEVSRIVYDVIEKIPNVIHTETALALFPRR